MKILSLALLQTLPATRDSAAAATSSTFLATAEAVSTILLTVLVLGLLLALVGLLLQMRKLVRSVGEVTRRLEKDAGPVMDKARSVAENVDFITAAVRSDIQMVNESVARLNGRLREASESMEERVQDFTALVEVLQSEAEELALDTAAAVRGVRQGTRALANGAKAPGSARVNGPAPSLPTASEEGTGEDQK